eukprot:gene10726-19506_t
MEHFDTTNIQSYQPGSCTKLVFQQEAGDNELIILEIIHRYVEILDKYFGNVCELDIIFNFEKAYFVLDELIIGGEIQETSKNAVLKAVSQQDVVQEDGEVPSLKNVLEELGLS